MGLKASFMGPHGQLVLFLGNKSPAALTGVVVRGAAGAAARLPAGTRAPRHRAEEAGVLDACIPGTSIKARHCKLGLRKVHVTRLYGRVTQLYS